MRLFARIRIPSGKLQVRVPPRVLFPEHHDHREVFQRRRGRRGVRKTHVGERNNKSAVSRRAIFLHAISKTTNLNKLDDLIGFFYFVFPEQAQYVQRRRQLSV